MGEWLLKGAECLCTYRPSAKLWLSDTNAALPGRAQHLCLRVGSCAGSHSGVKLCRWTKSMLRGRGGCYKHAFYGIESHRCMEATPSLACANKCVFCWRHHTNPGARVCAPELALCAQAAGRAQALLLACRVSSPAFSPISNAPPTQCGQGLADSPGA
jgi:hypothetical protein